LQGTLRFYGRASKRIQSRAHNNGYSQNYQTDIMAWQIIVQKYKDVKDWLVQQNMKNREHTKFYLYKYL
jgi:hypothetical protein